MSKAVRKRPSIFRNYCYSLFYQVTMYMIPLITTPYISRVFGAEMIGVQSYVTSIASYFTLFAALGTTLYGQQRIAQSRDDIKECSVLFWEIELFRIVTTLLTLAAWAVFTLFNRQYMVYYCILSLNILALIFDISWFYKGQELFSHIVIRNFIIRLLGCVLLFAVIKRADQLGLYIFILAATTLAGNLTMWVSLPGLIRWEGVKGLCLTRHIRPTLIYFIPTVATSVYAVLDKVMLGIMSPAFQENGYYEQANKIVSIGKEAIYSLNAIILSRTSYYFSSGNDDKAKNTLQMSTDFILFMGVAMAAGIIGIADNFVPWFFGEGYSGVCGVLRVTSFLVPIIGISNCLVNDYLTPSGRQGRANGALIAGALLNFCMNMVLIPRYFAVGAAVSSVAAEAAITLICIYMSREYMPCGLLWKLLWKKIIAACIMLCYLLYFWGQYRGSVMITGIQIITGGLLYTGALWLLRDTLIVQAADLMKQKLRKPHRGGRRRGRK